MAENVYKIAKWNSIRNPLEHVYGKECICPTLLARGQDNNAMMILISESFNDERNLRDYFLNSKSK